MNAVGTPMKREELKALKRYRFHKKIMEALDAQRTVRFCLRKSHLNLIEITMPHEGEFSWDIRKHGKYTYIYSDFVSELDLIFDEICSGRSTLECLAEEIDLTWETDFAWRTLETAYLPDAYEKEVMDKLLA